MSLECPNCREPVSLFRSLRTTAWGRFRCKACGSILGISFKRRMLALIPWFGVVAVLLLFVKVQRYGTVAVVPSLLATMAFVFYLFEDVVLIDRRAFCCRKCGYDLQGQVEARCPECGLEFDPTEKARILARIGSPVPRARHRWVLVVLIALCALTLLANILTHLGVRIPIGPAPAPTPPATTPVATPAADAGSSQ